MFIDYMFFMQKFCNTKSSNIYWKSDFQFVVWSCFICISKKKNTQDKRKNHSQNTLKFPAKNRRKLLHIYFKIFPQTEFWRNYPLVFNTEKELKQTNKKNKPNKKLSYVYFFMTFSSVFHRNSLNKILKVIIFFLTFEN